MSASDKPSHGLKRTGFENRVLAIVGLGIAGLAFVFLLPPIPQGPSYHAFADDRTLLGVPNLLNVASTLPFLLVGLLGLRELLRRDTARPNVPFLEASERWPFLVLFTGVLLTAFGSSYYHLAPANDRLVWDRLPMTVAFMGFFAGMIADRIDVCAGIWLLGPLVWLGFTSVYDWHRGEQHHAGDLRLYGFVQFYPTVAIPLLLYLFPARYTHTGNVIAAVAWYLLAKVLETEPVDHSIYAVGQVVSGHTLKHLAAGMGAYCLFRMVRDRRPDS